MTEGSDEFDSPWKDIIEVYFEEFMAFFFSEAHADIDWSHPVEFLDKELQQVVRDAEFGRRYVDKLAKVWRKDGTEQWVLAQLEGEKKMQYISSLERIGIQKGMEQGLQQGLEQGLEQGRQEGAFHLLLRILTHRFGKISEAVQAQLQKLSAEQIDGLVDLALTYQSLPEFVAQLPDAAGT